MENQKIEQGNREEEINLTQLFPKKKENKAYGYDYDPIEEIVIDGRTIIYRVAHNSIGIGFVTVLGEKLSEIHEKGGEQFIAVGIISSDRQGAISNLLKSKVKGRIDFL